MARLVLVTGLLAGLCVQASANGRAPGTSTINFQHNSDQKIVAGMTFGVVFTEDGGATWTWQCEDAVGYGGMYDPDYAITNNGTLFATTFDGLKVNRDGCVYEASSLSPPSPGIKFFSTITSGPDDAIYAAAADPMDGFIYKSTDNGVTFPTKAMPGEINDWWQTIEVAPGNASVVYLTGYRLKAGESRRHLLFRSANGGTSYTALPGSGETDLTPQGISVMPNSTLEIVGISKTDPDLVFLRVALSDNTMSDTIYRSVNGGQSWTKILEKQSHIAFVVRANGDLVAGTQALGSFRSVDDGTTFTPLAGAPHINCLAESPGGVVFACTQNYGSPQVPSDDAGIMKTTDLATWQTVLRFQDIKDPVPCPAGTVQKDKCDVVNWCPLCNQLGCQANRDCNVNPGVDAGTDTTVTPTDPGGCCDSGNGGLAGMMAFGSAVGMVVLRRRRRRDP